MDLLSDDYGLVDSGYHDLTDGYFRDQFPPTDGEYINPRGPDQIVSPVIHTPQTRTRSMGIDVSRVNNHKSSITTKNGINGEPMRVARVCRVARKRKGTGEKADKPKLPKLTKSLSELTRDYHDLPIRNMECWVHRSAEVRRQEVEKRGGYVTRPMNSFMLYRSAFAERTKLWCLQNNHQVVSSVSGESWPLEPAAIRDKYNELAKIERSNHQAAHPGYKFSPSKAQNSKKRKDSKSVDDNGASDNEPYADEDDYGTTVGGSRARKNPRGGKKNQKVLGQAQGAGNPINGYMGLCYDHMEGGAQRSSFTHNNPGKTPPMCMGSTDMSGQYYQTTVRANSTTPISHPMHPAIIEDVTIRKTQAPMGVMNQNRLYQMGSVDGYSLQSVFQNLHDNSKVDPALLGDESVRVSPYNNCRLQNIGEDDMLSSEFIDEGNYEPSQFDIDRLFAAATGSQIPDMHFPDGGVPSEPINHVDGSGMNPRFDVRKLPGYDQSMQGFLDNQDPWSVTGEIGHDEDQFRYDEWLQ
ncbi:hypothetical protein DFP73DRAFT_634122 [Morchella snyderi]|nr:hypothetical protein DFP73DRAFT_634122 [Morchella snyderi]